MGLLPLEFSDCMLDSPYFRENLKAHEKQLEQTYADLKTIRKEIQDVIEAAKFLSKAKRSLASSLSAFQFDCLGTSLTDDEVIISHSLREFSKILGLVEDEMDQMLEDAEDKFIKPLIEFRKDQIECVRKAKKDFDKQTQKFCGAQDRYITLKKEESLTESAESVRYEKKALTAASLEYVYLMHVVQERKKFELVEALLDFMASWTNYYKHGNSVCLGSAPYTNDLRSRVRKTRDNYSATIEHYNSLKDKMASGNGQGDPGVLNKMYTRQGYLYVQNGKTKMIANLGIGQSGWSKHFCQYQASTKTLTMIPYSQINGKITSTETVRVASCVCKEETANEKFRFIVAGEEIQNPGVSVSHTIQAMSEYERKHWVEAMGGTWPAVNTLQRIRADSVEENLNSLAFTFLKDCLAELEDRGLNDQGLYRVGGVVSKVKKLLNQGLDPQPGQSSLDLGDPKVWESKTIASAVKQYFRDLNKPLMTHTLYNKFIEAVKLESEEQRLQEIQALVSKLPISSREILKVLVRHLSKVAARSDRNLMTASNLGVCFGPTLLRPKEETVASIMDIKFSNQVVEILIENCDKFFSNPLLGSDSSPDVTRNSDVVDGGGGGGGVADTPTAPMTGPATNRGRNKKPREKRGSSTPKRTQSFSSFSQLSTSSLPDIKEFKDRALAALSAATSRNNSHHNNSSSNTSNNEHNKVSSPSATEILNNRFRSKSTTLNPMSSPAAKQIIQSVMPAPSKPVITTPRALGQQKTNSEQLIESLEMMKTLAADLPTNNSPLRRSYTVHARKLTRQAPVTSSPSGRKPPLPKASPTEERSSQPFEEPVGGAHYSSGSSSACSSNNGSLTQHHYRPPPPIPSHFVRINSVPALPTSAGAASTPPSLPQHSLFQRAHIGEDDDGKDTPPPIPVRRYRRIYVNNLPGSVNPVNSAECYSSESSDLAPPPVPAPRFAPSPRQHEQDGHVTSPSPLTADSGIAMSPPMRKVSEIRRQLVQQHHRQTKEADTASVGSSLSHSDDSKYDNLSASSSTSINSSHNRLNTSQSLVHAAAEIAAAKHQAAASSKKGQEEDQVVGGKKAVVRRHSSRIRRLSSSSSGSCSSDRSGSCSDDESSTCCCCGNGTDDANGVDDDKRQSDEEDEEEEDDEEEEEEVIEIHDHCVSAKVPPNRKSGPYENFIPPPVVDDNPEETGEQKSSEPMVQQQDMSTFQRLLAAGQTSNV